jgi:hypothetical protein
VSSDLVNLWFFFGSSGGGLKRNRILRYPFPLIGVSGENNGSQRYAVMFWTVDNLEMGIECFLRVRG